MSSFYLVRPSIRSVTDLSDIRPRGIVRVDHHTDCTMATPTPMTAGWQHYTTPMPMTAGCYTDCESCGAPRETPKCSYCGVSRE
jgi:hypothetical protein